MSENYPFAQEFITDTEGNVSKVVINFDDYQQILEMLEDKGLYNAMRITEDEISISMEKALKKLEKQG